MAADTNFAKNTKIGHFWVKKSKLSKKNGLEIHPTVTLMQNFRFLTPAVAEIWLRTHTHTHTHSHTHTH